MEKYSRASAFITMSMHGFETFSQIEVNRFAGFFFPT